MNNHAMARAQFVKKHDANAATNTASGSQLNRHKLEFHRNRQLKQWYVKSEKSPPGPKH